MTCPSCRIALLAIAVLALSSIISPSATAQQRVEVGNAASVAGNVTLENNRLEKPIKVKRRQRIAWGDVIRTKKNSQMQILLLDRSSFGIGQRSRVRIDRYVYDPNKGRSLFTTFIKGALRFFSGSSKGENSAEISTPSGRIGIRGTAIDMLVGEKAEDIAEDEGFVGSVRSDDDEATLVVLRGPGANTQSGLTLGLADVTGAGVTVVLDEPGLAAYIPREGAAPIGPFRISNRGLARVQNQILPRWARSLKNGGILDEVIGGAAAAAIIGAILGTTGGDDDGLGPNTGGIPNNPNNPTTGNDPNGNDNCENANGEPVRCPPGIN
ncbi:FecR family protein [Alterisphingorhabdus coralli]|uniref:FecR family protein n=1 Tax=Alterisphingorhabdus coralli TaxID=3071408 RepID=A0AA97I213_9SPHN|nr:FecR family protein [Parasphingorhabdus sp. SCSIO 66989]WOE75900.1 FecR family protein [Parasphingorhabdus sp. SCSIO 66989]